MTIHFLDVSCSDCGAKPGQPCKRALYVHSARMAERNRLRADAAAFEAEGDTAQAADCRRSAVEAEYDYREATFDEERIA